MSEPVKFSKRLTPLLDRVMQACWDLDHELREGIDLVEDTVSKGGNTRADIGLVASLMRDALGCICGARGQLAAAMDERAILAGERARPTLAQLQALNQPPAPSGTEGGG